MINNTLVVIPARGGSKGVPKKNSRPLAGKPLIVHTTDLARQLFSDHDICVSTDSPEIKRIVENTGLPVPFVRPKHLATDTASTRDVLLHAIDYYRSEGLRRYDKILLLQPTSPFRTTKQITEAVALFSANVVDMVVSVTEARENPYYTLFEMNTQGYLTKSKSSHFSRRQDCPTVFHLNGSIYVINEQSIVQSDISEFKKVVPYSMNELYSIDIDTELDWKVAEVVYQMLHGDQPT